MATPPQKNCYLGIKGKKYGPLSETEIIKLFDMKKINGDTKFARPGAKEWVSLSQAGVIPPEKLDDGLPPLLPDDGTAEDERAMAEMERIAAETEREGPRTKAESKKEKAKMEAEEAEKDEIDEISRLPLWQKIAGAAGSLGLVAAGIAIFLHYAGPGAEVSFSDGNPLGNDTALVSGNSQEAASGDIADIILVSSPELDGRSFRFVAENTSDTAFANAVSATSLPHFSFVMDVFDGSGVFLGEAAQLSLGDLLPGRRANVSIAVPRGDIARGELFLRETGMSGLEARTTDHRSDRWAVDFTGGQPVFANAQSAGGRTAEAPEESAAAATGGDWLDIGRVRIPPGWGHSFSFDASPLIVEAFGDGLSLEVSEIPFGSIDQLAEGRVSMSDFLFDDGHTGFVIEYPEAVMWVHERSWTSAMFRHGGDRELYLQNGGLLGAIAASLTDYLPGAPGGAFQLSGADLFDALIGEWVVESRGGGDIFLARGADVVFYPDGTGGDFFDDRARELLVGFMWLVLEERLEVFFGTQTISFDAIRQNGDEMRLFNLETSSEFVLRRTGGIGPRFLVAQAAALRGEAQGRADALLFAEAGAVLNGTGNSQPDGLGGLWHEVLVDGALLFVHSSNVSAMP